MPQTLVEKIAQRFAVGLPPGHEVHSGDYLSIRPRHVMTHDNTAAVIPKFQSMGATRVTHRAQPVFALDHDIQNTSAENAAKYARIEHFAREHGLAFFPAGRGIGHQIMIEEGFVLPGSFVVGSDSHSNMYGALGALGTPVVRTDAAAIWATGRTWWQVPEVVKVNLRGELRPGVSGKDVIIALIGVFSHDEVLNRCLEFTGPGVASLDIDQRMTIANMTTEWGALAGIFPYDGITRQYLLTRAQILRKREGEAPAEPHRRKREGEAPAEPLASGGLPTSAARLTPELIERLEADLPVADPDAFYAKELDFDLSAVTPLVAGPNEVKRITPLPELEAQNVRIDRAYLMSCVNARLRDFEAAAEAIEGRRVAEHVRFYIAAASSEVEELAKECGSWQTLLDAGAIALPPGCGACIGLGEGVLAAGEVGISATNRNFKGRMGSPGSFVYLASPTVVAASAVAGRIAGPKAAAAGPRTGRTEPRPSGSSREGEAPAEPHRHEREGEAPAEPSAGETPMPPDALGAMKRAASCRVNERPAAGRSPTVAILPSFPERIEGELLWTPKDNLNTDGIYGKEYTYKELPPEQMAAVAMANYDPEFQRIARAGDILVGGNNFGSGSSREQAATALKHRGLAMIIAGSFSQTYKRNAFNNGYICIECPELVDDLKAAFAGISAPTMRTGRPATVDFTKSQIVVGRQGTGNGKRATEPRPSGSAREGEAPAEPSAVTREREGEAPAEPRVYSFSPLGAVAQELIVKGGFEAVIRDQLATAT